MRKTLLVVFVLLMIAAPAHAERWVRVDKQLFIDTESLFTDSDGYARFKTRELNADGTSVMHQHKEAVNCEKNMHYFRQMYAGAAVVNNKSDADVDKSTWADWRQNPRQVYPSDRQSALKTFVCNFAKKKK